ncbi:MAG: serine peptidase, partial [Pseudorhodoplanes sp.]
MISPRFFPGRRTLLLATTIVSFGVATLLVAPDAARHAAFAQDVSQQARTVARPVGFADIVEKVKPAVIAVRVKVDRDGPSNVDSDSPLPPGSPLERFFRRFGAPDDMPRAPRGPRGRNFTTGQGSGFFISADGFAVTNNHVVDKAETVSVQTDDGKSHTAKVIGTDPRTDLALIKVDGNNFPFARLSDKLPRVGDWVLAVGNPFGLSSTVTAGIVSARGRDIGSGPYDDFLQIDA